MYSNMVSRQWFIGVKSNTDKQKTGSVTPIQTSKAGERSPPLRSVEQILRKLRAASAAAVRRVAAPYRALKKQHSRRRAAKAPAERGLYL